MQHAATVQRTNPAEIAAPMARASIVLGRGLELPATRLNFARNEEVFGEAESAEYVYQVISGALRMTRFLADGRRQVAAFGLPGDIVGLEVGDFYRYSAEAIVDTTLAVIKRSALERSVEHDAAAMRQVWVLTSGQLEDVQNQMLLLGRKTAMERVVAFLLEMSRRNKGAHIIDLPMSRTDIADYLGLTIETISRTLTQLQRSDAISLPSSRHVVLRNKAALANMDS